MVVKRATSLRREVPFFHRKISKGNKTRTLAIGKILPEDWTFVKLKVLKMKERTCYLEVTKLD